MWNRTTNVDVSNGEIRLSLAGLEDDQNGRKDATRQPGLYENFESGSKFFLVTPNFVCNRLRVFLRAYCN